MTAWCQDCSHCQRAKTTKQYTAPLAAFPTPERRFAHIHLDLVGPLPASSSGFTHLLTMVDRSTRWLEAVPLSETSSVNCMDAFISTWISRFGVPAVITTDRGVQFSSASWAASCQRLGITHHLTTAYHPQANGMIERTHRQLKDSLRARLAGSDWPSHLPWVLLGLRSAPKEESGVSSAELVQGSPLVLPGQFLESPEPPPEVFLRRLQAAPHTPSPAPSYAEATAMANLPEALRTATLVYVKRGQAAPPLTPVYQGPYTVVSRTPKYFVLDLGGRQETVTVDRLKPHLGHQPMEPAVAPRRGRPPNVSSLFPAPDPLAPSLGGGTVEATRCPSGENAGVIYE